MCPARNTVTMNAELRIPIRFGLLGRSHEQSRAANSSVSDSPATDFRDAYPEAATTRQ